MDYDYTFNISDMFTHLTYEEFCELVRLLHKMEEKVSELNRKENTTTSEDRLS